MPFFETRIAEDVTILIDSMSSGAFAKNEVSSGMNPDKAFDNLVIIASNIAKGFGDGMNARLPLGGSAELQFGVKCDPSGAVMVATSPNEGQFAITIRVGA